MKGEVEQTAMRTEANELSKAALWLPLVVLEREKYDITTGPSRDQVPRLGKTQHFQRPYKRS